MKSIQRNLVKYFIDVYNNQSTKPVLYDEIYKALKNNKHIHYRADHSDTSKSTYVTIKIVSRALNRRFMEIDLKVHRDNTCEVQMIRTTEYTMYLESTEVQIIYKTPQTYNRPQNSIIQCLKGLNDRTIPSIQNWMSTDKSIIAKRGVGYRDQFCSAPRDIKAFEYSMRTGETV